MHTPVPRPSPKSVHRAFVVQFGTETNVPDGRIAGRVEHVSSGQATEFHSLADLLAFIARLLAQAPQQRENQL